MTTYCGANIGPQVGKERWPRHSPEKLTVLRTVTPWGRGLPQLGDRWSVLAPSPGLTVRFRSHWLWSPGPGCGTGWNFRMR